MDDQIYFNGVRDYLVWYLNVPSYTALDIVGCLDDYSNPDEIFNVGLEDFLLEEVINKLKAKTSTHPIKVCSYLLGLSFPHKTADLIIKHFGPSINLISVIKANPYDLIVVEGLNFSRIDKIALEKLGFDENSPLRSEALVQHHLDSYCNRNGHLFVTLQAFINSKFEVFIPPNKIKEFLKKLILSKKIILEGKKLYTLGNYSAETMSADIIAQKITSSSNHSFFKTVDPDEFIDGYERIQSMNINEGEWKHSKWGDKAFKLSKQQKEVVYKFLKEKFLVVTGLPGTGKTTVTKALVDISKSRGLRVGLMAPTGIAAKRIGKTCDHDANTIHKELRFDGSTWNRNEKNLLDYDVIIVDEFSMVDQVLLYQLLRSLPKKEHMLIFVGDDAQLQSVAPGNVLRELINCGKIHHVKLTEIFRQKDTSDIVYNAHLINRGKTDLISVKKDFIFTEIQDEDKILANIMKIVDTLEDREYTYQILSPTYKGVVGVININNTMQEALNVNPSHVFFKTNNYIFKIEDKIMITKNDYSNNVYNGEQGIISEINKSTKKIVIYINRTHVEYSFKDAYSMMTLDYARTVHKAQGQEYDYVIMPYVNSFSIQLQRNLLYTAITRAKKKVFMLGHRSALVQSIKNNSVSRRNTIFSSRISTRIAKYETGDINEILQN